MNPRLGIRVTLIFLSLFLIAARSSAQGLHPYGPPTRPQLQLSINSGLPDPVGELSDEDLKNIQEMLDKLPIDPEPAYKTAAPDKLGYRGYVIGMLSNGKTGQYVVVTVYRTGVEIRTFIPEEQKSAAVIKLDSSRAGETMLTKLAAAKGLVSPFAQKDIDSGVDKRDKREK